MEEESERIGIENLEIFGGNVGRVGTESVGRLLVAPSHHHAAPSSPQGWKARVSPVVGGVVVLKASFRHSHRFPLFLGHFGEGCHVLLEGLCVESVVAVHAHEVHPFVAWPAEEDALLGMVVAGIHLWGDGIDDIVAVLFVAQVAHDETPEGLELLVGSGLGSPPVPGLGMFMEQT